MDKIKKTFDKWATTGRAELMEHEHANSVQKFLSTVSFDKPFSILDVGCGNGWVIRKIAKMRLCKKAVGIDKSKNMIRSAISKKNSSKEEFYQADIQNWKYNGRFDYVFSMEAIYYSESLDIAIKKIFKLLKNEGQFFCGTDFYKDNKATVGWAKKMKLQMHLRSKKEWRELFKKNGFKTKTKQIKDPNSRKKWKREFGTLFIIGTK